MAYQQPDDFSGNNLVPQYLKHTIIIIIHKVLQYELLYVLNVDFELLFLINNYFQKVR
jgi:hypothetical protein